MGAASNVISQLVDSATGQLAAKDAEIAALKHENATLMAQAEEDCGVIYRLKTIIAEERAQLEKSDALADSMDDCSACENPCESYALSKDYKEARHAKS